MMFSLKILFVPLFFSQKALAQSCLDDPTYTWVQFVNSMFEDRDCAWLMSSNNQRETNERIRVNCALTIGQDEIKDRCPYTCDSCPKGCYDDPYYTFGSYWPNKGPKITRNCAWINNTDRQLEFCDKLRNGRGVSEMCSVACNVCDDGCTDSPKNWRNSFNDNCAWYAEGNRCQNYGNKYRYIGFVANQVCCVCGGGSRNKINTENTETIA
mmetsp:Transcript_32045/g.63486  ORF Transcript_32045/g.63486 Transcript_32045/m.63486 type:complete len:211 (-) Transcript_32045:190-822(-)